MPTFLKNVHWTCLLYEEWHFIRKTIILNILWSHHKMSFNIVSFTIKYISSLSFHDFSYWTISSRFLQTLICHTSSSSKQFRDFFAIYEFDLRSSCSYITRMILLIFFIRCDKLARLLISRFFFHSWLNWICVRHANCKLIFILSLTVIITIIRDEVTFECFFMNRDSSLNICTISVIYSEFMSFVIINVFLTSRI